MKIDLEKFVSLAKTVHENANKAEIDAMNAYLESGADQRCYQEDFYKVWVNEKITDLETKLAQAEEKLTKYRKAIMGLKELPIALHNIELQKELTEKDGEIEILKNR